ncbi:MAG TPA: hypothetical protein EYQ50_21480 [Verrucomicrobiales bacterium]|nr:hypothetical protein [Verrucomicrobiales bacterium]
MKDFFQTKTEPRSNEGMDHRGLPRGLASHALFPLLWMWFAVVGCIPCAGQSVQIEEVSAGADPALGTTASASEATDDDFGETDDDFGEATTSPINHPPGHSVPNNSVFNPKTYKSASEAHLTFLKALESEDRFPSAATCSECHPDHYREWSVSAHAYSQMSPMFNTMQATIVDLTAGTNGDFCIRCHTQVGMQRSEPLFTSNLKRHPASIEGITCVVCHRVANNYGKISGRSHIIKGDIFTPMSGPSGDTILRETLEVASLKNKLNIQKVDVTTGERPKGKKHLHATIKKFDPISRSGFCGSCHDVNLLDGFRLEEAFSQFKNSPAARKEQQWIAA